MKAVVFHGVGDIRLDEVPQPRIQDPTDTIVRRTASAICGTDLHFIWGTMPGVREGVVLGHEGVGVVEELGDRVRIADTHVVIEAYEAFDQRRPGWLKVALDPVTV